MDQLDIWHAGLPITFHYNNTFLLDEWIKTPYIYTTTISKRDESLNSIFYSHWLIVFALNQRVDLIFITVQHLF
jgi:hypothetical protein